MKQSSFQRDGHSLITSRTIRTHQDTIWGQIRWILALHTTWSLSATLSLNFCYKTPHQILLGLGHTVFSNQELCPPWPEKAIKLFTQNSYLQYSIQHWCRGWVFSINMTTDNYTLAHLPSIFLLRDWVLCCCSCWPSTCPEGHSGERMRHSVLQENWWNRSQIDIFRNGVHDPNPCISSYLLKH